MSTFRRVMQFAICAVVVVGLAGLMVVSKNAISNPESSVYNLPDPTESKEYKENHKKLEELTAELKELTQPKVIGAKWSDDNGTPCIVGRVKNLTDKPYRYVQIDANLYGKNGDLIDSKYTNVLNLEANQVWRFQMLVTDPNVHSYKITGCYGNR